MLRVSIAGVFLLRSLYTPNAAKTASAKTTTAVPISVPLSRRASAISTELDDAEPEAEIAAVPANPATEDSG